LANPEQYPPERVARVRQNLSQSQLAAMALVSKQVVVHIEAGIGVNANNRRRVRRALGLEEE